MSLTNLIPTGRDIRRWVESGELTGFELASKLLFLALLIGLIGVSVIAGSILVAILASFAVGLMLRVMLPTGRFQAWARDLWTGRAGDRWERRSDRWLRKLRRFR